PEEGIVAGDTLLITSLRYVEDKLHTVILRAHPRVYGQTVAIVTEDSSGYRRERGKEMREHRFLVKDFLSSFVFEPDHKVIRDAELRQAQEEVNSLQASLTALVSDAQGLRDLAIEQLGTDDRENPVTGISVALVPSQEQQAVTSLAIGSVQNALSSGISDTRIEQIREAALKEGQISTAISKIITQRTQAIANASKRMLPYFEEVAAARFKSIGRYLRFWQAVASSGLPMNMVIREKPYQLMVALIALYTAIPVVTIVILSGQQSHKLELIAVHFITFITMVFVLRRKMGKRWLDLFEEKLAIYKPNDKLALSELHESIREKNGLDLQDLQDWYWKEKMTYAYHKEHKTTISYQKFK
ncbi:hypothetical protein ACG75L_004178, partial [Salmonella enterica subsp. enterica serovar Kentucky]